MIIHRVCLESSNKHGKLHQGLDYIVIIYGIAIDFDWITVVFESMNKCLKDFFIMSLDVEKNIFLIALAKVWGRSLQAIYMIKTTFCGLKFEVVYYSSIWFK